MTSAQMMPGVKDEPFEVSNERSQEAVDLAKSVLESRGFGVVQLVRDKTKPDDGDLLIWKYREPGHIKHSFRTLDVKQNANWCAGSFKYLTIYLTTKKQLHPDWLYIAYSNDLRSCAYVDMRKVPMELVEYDETFNRRGELQLSAGVPVKFFTFGGVK